MEECHFQASQWKRKSPPRREICVVSPLLLHSSDHVQQNIVTNESLCANSGFFQLNKLDEAMKEQVKEWVIIILLTSSIGKEGGKESDYIEESTNLSMVICWLCLTFGWDDIGVETRRCCKIAISQPPVFEISSTWALSSIYSFYSLCQIFACDESFARIYFSDCKQRSANGWKELSGLGIQTMAPSVVLLLQSDWLNVLPI